MTYNWHRYFPFQKPRKEQIQLLEFALSINLSFLPKYEKKIIERYGKVII